jgi:hypothetical protein
MEVRVSTYEWEGVMNILSITASSRSLGGKKEA